MKNLKGIILGAGVALAMLSACTTGNEVNLTVSKLDPAKFDTLINEVSAFVKKVYLYIENEPDMKKNLQTLGAWYLAMTTSHNTPTH